MTEKFIKEFIKLCKTEDPSIHITNEYNELVEYPESMYELDPKKVTKWFQSKLTELERVHREEMTKLVAYVQHKDFDSYDCNACASILEAFLKHQSEYIKEE